MTSRARSLLLTRAMKYVCIFLPGHFPYAPKLMNSSKWHPAARSPALISLFPQTDSLSLHMVPTLRTRRSPNPSGKPPRLPRPPIPHPLPSANHTSSHSLWREERDKRLQQRSADAKENTEKTKQFARQYIDDFYENYNANKEKQIAKTRKDAEEFLAKREDTSSGGTNWERTSKLVDLSGKGAKGELSPNGPSSLPHPFSERHRSASKYVETRNINKKLTLVNLSIGGPAGGGKEKFKQMLLDRRKDENAPGASGYGTEVKPN